MVKNIKIEKCVITSISSDKLMTDSSEEQFYYRGITLQDFGWIKGKMKQLLHF